MGSETETGDLRLGVHARGPGPGDTASLPYFSVADLPAAVERVRDVGGSVIHPGDRWAVCRDSEGEPVRVGRCAVGRRSMTVASATELSCRVRLGRERDGLAIPVRDR